MTPEEIQQARERANNVLRRFRSGATGDQWTWRALARDVLALTEQMAEANATINTKLHLGDLTPQELDDAVNLAHYFPMTSSNAPPHLWAPATPPRPKQPPTEQQPACERTGTSLEHKSDQWCVDCIDADRCEQQPEPSPIVVDPAMLRLNGLSAPERQPEPVDEDGLQTFLYDACVDAEIGLDGDEIECIAVALLSRYDIYRKPEQELDAWDAPDEEDIDA